MKISAMLLNRYSRPFAIFETIRRNKPRESIWQTGTGLMKMNFSLRLSLPFRQIIPARNVRCTSFKRLPQSA